MLNNFKGLPLSYFKDLQDDKELVFKTNEILNNCISILNEVLNNFSPNKKNVRTCRKWLYYSNRFS